MICNPLFRNVLFFVSCGCKVMALLSQYLFGSVHQSLKDAPEVYSQSYIVTMLYVPLIGHLQKC